ncbi:predicted protein [Arabidopsis lyrata subsp. lyrata]|uniref:Predicted protein n=1 Tax=Arabidopsis lyrata subsp. lyrata TaxID=81972 RepID=D7MKE6_ARALL|nr:predicted protein [Arabidopsis lyrata subsp. lyrata]
MLQSEEDRLSKHLRSVPSSAPPSASSSSPTLLYTSSEPSQNHPSTHGSGNHSYSNNSNYGGNRGNRGNRGRGRGGRGYRGRGGRFYNNNYWQPPYPSWPSPPYHNMLQPSSHTPLGTKTDCLIGPCLHKDANKLPVQIKDFFGRGKHMAPEAQNWIVPLSSWINSAFSSNSDNTYRAGYQE